MKKQLLMALAAIALFSAGCAKQTASTTTDSTSTNASLTENKDRVRKVYDAFNTKDFSKLDSLIAPDFVDHDPGPGQQPGLAGLKKDFAEFQKGYPDFHFTPDQMIAEGDLVSSHYRMTGTNSGPMMDMPATNKKVDVGGMDLVRVKNGMIVERWGVQDNWTMMHQLGLAPGPDTTKAHKKK